VTKKKAIKKDKKDQYNIPITSWRERKENKKIRGKKEKSEEEEGEFYVGRRK